MRMDYYRNYKEIVANYNREKDRVTIHFTVGFSVGLFALRATEALQPVLAGGDLVAA
jgi:hypothetical protein